VPVTMREPTRAGGPMRFDLAVPDSRHVPGYFEFHKQGADQEWIAPAQGEDHRRGIPDAGYRGRASVVCQKFFRKVDLLRGS